MPQKVFQATVDTHALVFELLDVSTDKEFDFIVDVRRNGEIKTLHTLPMSFIPNNGEPINVVVSHKAQQLYRKIKHIAIPASEACSVFNGIKPFEKGKGKPPQTAKTMEEQPYVKEGDAPGADWSPLLRGSLIGRYINLWNKDYWVLYGEWLAAPRDETIFDAPTKIMVRQTGDSIIATLVERGFIARNNLHILLPKDNSYDVKYILGNINSPLTNFFYSVLNPERGEALAEVKKNHVEQLPIGLINHSDKADRARHDRMVSLVEQMLDAKRQLQTARTDSDRNHYETRCAALDRQIDNLVYELYALTPAEIAIIEASSEKG